MQAEHIWFFCERDSLTCCSCCTLLSVQSHEYRHNATICYSDSAFFIAPLGTNLFHNSRPPRRVFSLYPCRVSIASRSRIPMGLWNRAFARLLAGVGLFVIVITFFEPEIGKGSLDVPRAWTSRSLIPHVTEQENDVHDISVEESSLGSDTTPPANVTNVSTQFSILCWRFRMTTSKK